MDFSDNLRALSDKVAKLKEQILTEEATKNAFIMPFIQLLGYDIFNPLEVIPEYIADLGIKKGEKVDYCILKDGNPVLIVECKHWGEDLNVHNSQLHRYFHVSKARFGLLTNGVVYRFYTDLEEANKMDEKPFLEFSMLEMKDNIIQEVKRFHKANFDLSEILSTANDLKYAKEVRHIMTAELNNPTEEFVKFFASQIYKGRISAKVLDQFKSIVKKSLGQLFSDMISDRLKTALDNETKREEAIQAEEKAMQEAAADMEEKKIVTTEEEMEAFYIIKSILRNHVNSKRIFFRDNQSYLAIILDDSIRRQLCRLWLNGAKKYISLFDEGGKENKVPIQNIEDIYQHAEHLVATAMKYEPSEKSRQNKA